MPILRLRRLRWRPVPCAALYLLCGTKHSTLLGFHLRNRKERTQIVKQQTFHDISPKRTLVNSKQRNRNTTHESKPERKNKFEKTFGVKVWGFSAVRWIGYNWDIFKRISGCIRYICMITWGQHVQHVILHPVQDATQMEFMWNAAFVMPNRSWMFHAHQKYGHPTPLMSVSAVSPVSVRLRARPKTLQLCDFCKFCWAVGLFLMQNLMLDVLAAGTEVLLSTGHRAELLLGQQLPARPWWLLCRWHPRAVSLLRQGFRWCLQTHPLSLWKSHISVTGIALRSPKLCAMAKVSCRGAAGGSNASPFELRPRWVLSWRKCTFEGMAFIRMTFDDFWMCESDAVLRHVQIPNLQFSCLNWLPRGPKFLYKVPACSATRRINVSLPRQNSKMFQVSAFCINIIKSFRYSQLGKLSEHVLSGFIATCCWCCWQSLHMIWTWFACCTGLEGLARWRTSAVLLPIGWATVTWFNLGYLGSRPGSFDAISRSIQMYYRCITDVYNILNMLSLSMFILV